MKTAWEYLNGPWEKWYTERLALESQFGDRDAFNAEVRRMARAIAGHDPATADHSVRVWRYATAVAEELGLDARQREQLGVAAKLHDVGKICIPAAILNKPGELNADEARWVQDHAVVGERIVRTLTPCPAVAEAVRGHHERHDGTGYPDGLRGDAVPYLARLLAVADAYAAMTDARPYAPPLTGPDALAVLRRESGRQFHPEAVEALIRAVGKLVPFARPIISADGR